MTTVMGTKLALIIVPNRVMILNCTGAATLRHRESEAGDQNGG